jgi:hypothetical protein
MPITDEILENAMEIITSELKKLDQYQKTNIKK